MAYFERVDTRNDGNPILVLCNICNVNCAERSITTHKMKCRARPNHKVKFEEGGELEVCQYDTSHIVKVGTMGIHLEFCNKRQSKIVAEFQEAYKEATKSPSESISVPQAVVDHRWHTDSAWDNECDDQVVTRMGQLKLQ